MNARFDKGTAEAIVALCQLFLVKDKTDFIPNYLACFYRGLEEVKTESTVM